MLLNTFAECYFAPFIGEIRKLHLYFELAGRNVDYCDRQLTVSGYGLFKKRDYAKHIKLTISCTSVRITSREES